MDMNDKQHVCKLTYNKSLDNTMTAWKCETEQSALNEDCTNAGANRKKMGGEGGEGNVSCSRPTELNNIFYNCSIQSACQEK